MGKRLIVEWGPLSIADFNGDGFDELFGTVYVEPNEIGDYRAFEYLSRIEKIREDRPIRDVRFADFDNDGELDAIANIYPEEESNPPKKNEYVMLFWGKNGAFIEDENFKEKRYRGKGETILIADFDQNGYIDIFVPQYVTKYGEYSRNLLFKNLGNRTLVEDAVEAGVDKGVVSAAEGGQVIDINLDGLPDIYAGGTVFVNNGRFKFKKVNKEIGLPGSHDEGVAFFDYDNDGDLDLVIMDPNRGPFLYENNNGYFTEKINMFTPHDYHSSYGLAVGDVNTDGYDDIIIAGGLNEIGKPSPPSVQLYNGKSYKRYVLNPKVTRLGWSDLVGAADLNYDGSDDVFYLYDDKKIIELNGIVPQSFIKVNVVSNGIKSRQGTYVLFESVDSQKGYFVDGGSGYMSNKPYSINYANLNDQNIRVKVNCSERMMSYTMKSGTITFDCSRNLITKSQ